MDKLTERFEDFVTVVTRAYKSIQKIKNTETECMGLKVSHVMCLYYLGKHTGGLTAGALCKLCNEDKAAISRTITDLTDRGYVISDSSTERKYRNSFRLTESGLAQSMDIKQAVADVVCKASVGFSDDERKVFYRVFCMIADNLEAICN